MKALNIVNIRINSENSVFNKVNPHSMKSSLFKLIFLTIIALKFEQVITLKSFASKASKKSERECKFLPKISRPKLLECCALPDFFKPDIREKCVSECSDSEDHHDPWCCMSKCAMEETELGVNGTINKTLVKKYFYGLFNSTEIRKVIDKTLTKCENETPDTQTEHCDHPEYGSLLSCIHHELFKTCITAKSDSICQKIRNFIRKCPSRKDDLFDTK